MTRRASRTARAVGLLAGLLWVAYFAALQWSVVRFSVLIVAVLTVSAAALALWQWRAGPDATAWLAGWQQALALSLAGGAVVTVTVRTFSYLPSASARLALSCLAAGGLASGVLALRGRWRALVAVSVAAYLVAAVVAIRTDPAPRIDVWVILQQASDGLTRGRNPYAMTWVGSPGIKDAFTYLPWTLVLVAPGRWLAGDVRWALVAWTLVAAAGVAQLGRSPFPRTSPRRWSTPGAGSVALVLLVPGTLTQTDQSWTEPLLLAGLVWWAVLVRRGAAWWAVLPLALACASKQHLALLLPVLLVWRAFGWRRTLTTGALTGALVSPWLFVGPADFVHDTVSLLVTFHPIRFANTIYLLALNRFGVALPFWLTGLVVLGTLLAVVVTVRRRQPDTAALLRWLALLLLVANLANKQAFYNQFWLSGALVAASLAATWGDHQEPGQSREPVETMVPVESMEPVESIGQVGRTETHSRAAAVDQESPAGRREGGPAERAEPAQPTAG